MTSHDLRVFVGRAQYGLTLALTPSTGRAQLYASFSTERPTAAAGAHEYTSACEIAGGAGGSGSITHGAGACAPSLSRGVALHVAHDSPSFCRRLPCLLYVSVRGERPATFSLLATVDDQEERAVPLTDGDVQIFALPHAGSCARHAPSHTSARATGPHARQTAHATGPHTRAPDRPRRQTPHCTSTPHSPLPADAARRRVRDAATPASPSSPRQRSAPSSSMSSRCAAIPTCT